CRSLRIYPHKRRLSKRSFRSPGDARLLGVGPPGLRESAGRRHKGLHNRCDARAVSPQPELLTKGGGCSPREGVDEASGRAAAVAPLARPLSEKAVLVVPAPAEARVVRVEEDEPAVGVARAAGPARTEAVDAATAPHEPPVEERGSKAPAPVDVDEARDREGEVRDPKLGRRCRPPVVGHQPPPPLNR